MKILILLAYWERPELVKNALNSVLRANRFYNNWELSFIDDSSPTAGKPIVEVVMKDWLNKVNFYHTNQTPEQKLKTGGEHGKWLNQAISESDADVAIVLCDDDELCEQYLLNLNQFFTKHPEEIACYSHIHIYNPFFEKSEHVNNPDPGFRYTERINLFTKTDASQVAWRLSANVWFDHPGTKFLDAGFYKKLDAVNSDGFLFSGCFAQYKGVHRARMIYHETDALWLDGPPDGERSTPLEEIYPIIDRYTKQNKHSEAIRICEQAINLHPHDTNLYLLLREASK